MRRQRRSSDNWNEAPSAFIMEPPAIMLHFYDRPWNDDLSLLTYVSILEETPAQYGDSYLRFGEGFPN